MRVVRNVIAFLFFLVGAFAVVLTFALYLAATGRNVAVVRTLATATGRVLAGQETTAMAVDVQLRPDSGRLSGTARLTVRATNAARGRVYYLLNEGLTIDGAWREADGKRTPADVLRFGPLVVVELGGTLEPGDEAQVVLAYGGRPQPGLAPGLVLEPDEVTLTPADLWYPADAQSFFLADVEVLLPSTMTLVHNGREARRVSEGAATRVRFSLDRPVAGLALVAGRYRVHEGERDGTRARVFLPEDVTLDPQRLLDALGVSHQMFTARYGSPGFGQLSLFVARRLRRAFNDGTGVIGVPPRYFTDGEYGFPLIAHEVAHTWWGATVSERWLQPGTGGEWVVEGFAELSSWRAVREHLGAAALLRTLASSFFDPDRTVALVEPSMIDNALAPESRATIYNKGAYVAYMLMLRLGEPAFDAAARQLLEQFRYRAVTADDVEAAFAGASEQNLEPFFAAWVRGNESIDLALDPQQDGGAMVRNHRTAPPPATLDLWRFPPDSEPERQTTELGATMPIGNAERVVLDPLAAVADMFRGNNVLPREDNPRLVTRSARGDLMIVTGEPYPWEPAVISVRSPEGTVERTWTIDRGLLTEPVWSADGTRILAVESPRGVQPTLLALNVADGSRQVINRRDTVAAGSADATLVARGDTLLRLQGGRTTVLAEHPGGHIVAPIVASTGAVAYGVVWKTQMLELHLLPADGGGDRVLFSWPAGGLRWRWAPDGRRLYAAIPGDWDWQLWELATDGSAPRPLVREAAVIRDLTVAPNGDHIAIVAQADIDDPLDRAELFIIDRASSDVRRFNLSGRTAFRATWLDDESLAVIVADPTFPSLPIRKELQRVQASDGAMQPLS